jgi:acetoin:2,6-dichlorophenolindophenol oxidoreductase subunit alpha
VPPELVEEWSRKDPIDRFRTVLLERGVATWKDFADIDARTKAYAASEAQLAEDAPLPDPATVARGVYAGDDAAQPTLEFVTSPFAT